MGPYQLQAAIAALHSQAVTAKKTDLNYLLHAARADLLRRLNHFGEAAEAYRSAAKLATNRAEKAFSNGAYPI